MSLHHLGVMNKKEALMKRIARIIVSILLAFVTSFAQNAKQEPAAEQVIRISVDLVQIDVVVTDRNGKVAKGLSRNDFEIFESGRKQQTSFFEFVDTGKGGVPSRAKTQAATSEPTPSPQDHGVAGLRRTFAFVVDDLT